MDRRSFLRQVGCGSLLGSHLAPIASARVSPLFDVVIRGGLIFDGTGVPPWSGDIGVRGDTILAIGRIPTEQGLEVIDASGLCVSPGFIDIHTHSDESILRYKGAESRICQGITTEVTGNCGSSVAPVFGLRVEERRRDLANETGQPVKWSTVDQYFQVVQRQGLAVNHALLVGQGMLRSSLLGGDARLAAEDEMSELLRVLEDALEQGAFGLSTGLEYTPGRWTPVSEITALNRVVARYDGLYASHLRNEESALIEAVEEAIEVGHQTGVRVEISHLKAAGRENWHKQEVALERIESARRYGVQVLADAYPYPAYSTGLTIFLPTWALKEGRGGLQALLDSRSDRARLRDEVSERVSQDPGDFGLIQISSVASEQNRPLIGQRLDAIASRWGLEPAVALLRLLREEKGSVGFIGFGMSEENVDRVLAHPLVMVGSDGSSMAPEGPAAETRPHPRSYGAFVRVLGNFVRDRRVLGLPEAIRKMTSLPADQAGIRDRGRISRGRRADLVIFDASRVADRATFQRPHQLAAGIHHVMVNGRLVLEDGEKTGLLPGRMLRRA